MGFNNSWKVPYLKQIEDSMQKKLNVKNFYKSLKVSRLRKWTKFDLTLKISKLTVLRIKFDLGSKKYNINILNFGIKNK